MVVDTTKVLTDTVAVVSHSGGGHGEKFEFSHLLDHVKDSREVEIPFGHFELPHFKPLHIGGLIIDLSPTKHVFFLVLSAAILVLLALYAARRYKKDIVPTGTANAFESLVLFIRDEVAIPNMGRGGTRYVPYLLTTFFFILIMNLIGLVPFGVTATGNIAVTAGLAIIAFFMIQISAIRAQGLAHYLAHLTGGVHWLLWPIMVPIEVLGLFTKPFALCIRLFANMTGGHIVILSLIGLIFLFRSFVVAPVSVLFALGINMLEIFVAFLQAYVFTMLTSLFMGLGMQAGHEEQAHTESH
ncbi:MAG: F0F1 ATP synthase subunit A [Ignavibacteriales bacterium]|nr:F0F1 ATP synthase subunit A [Ignavibacteriales bacterium]